MIGKFLRVLKYGYFSNLIGSRVTSGRFFPFIGSHSGPWRRSYVFLVPSTSVDAIIKLRTWFGVLCLGRELTLFDSMYKGVHVQPTSPLSMCAGRFLGISWCLQVQPVERRDLSLSLHSFGGILHKPLCAHC